MRSFAASLMASLMVAGRASAWVPSVSALGTSSLRRGAASQARSSERFLSGAGAWVGEAYGFEMEAAVKAVASACGVAKALQRAGIERYDKSDLSPVTVADIAVQCVVVSRLREAFPGDSFVAEESASDMLARGPEGLAALEGAARACGTTVEALVEAVDLGRAPRGGAARTWVLDPVDGTKGFLRGAQFCVALALLDATSPASHNKRDAVLGRAGKG